jgi:DHA1 family bicyclomycin/chloramphenicol resistance-like MFS transporter
VVQAIGACAGVVLGRAMVRDLYEGDHAARMLSTLLTVMAVAPLLGPSLGGQILALAGWRAIFWTLVGIGALTLGAPFVLPETLPSVRRNHEPFAHAFSAYAALLRHRQLMLYAGASGFFYSGIFAYIAGSPFAYIAYYHVNPSLYGLLFGAGIIGIMASNLINAWLVIKLGRVRLLRAGTSGAALAAIVLAIDARTGWGGLAGLVLPLFVFIGLTGFTVANSIAGVLDFSPTRAGAASALVGAIQYGAGIAGSALVGAFADGTPWPMGCVIALAGIGSAACAWAIVPARFTT